MNRTSRFRQMIEAPEILVLPGVHDALSLRIAEQAGFLAVTCGGYSATAGLLGQPDVAQLTMTEMAEMYARLCDSTELPLFADADTGYGNTTNVARTLRAYERAGVAGLFIEDQVSPKRCGHMEGKRVVPAAEMVAKLKAALDARVDADLIICARTDARAVHGLSEAIDRAQLYREAGADLLFVEAPVTVEEMRRVCSEIPAPCLANNIEGGRTPILTPAELADMGFEIAIYGISLLMHSVRTMQDVLGKLAQGDVSFIGKGVGFEEYKSIVGFDDWAKIEDKFS